MADSVSPLPTVQTKERLAIQEALKANWQKAVTLNQEIIDEDPKNSAALNRLGIAYLKLNKVNLAKKAFQTVLQLDPYNSIAKTNLKKANPKYTQNSAVLLATQTLSFIEEPGKSKVIKLNSLGEPPVLSQLYTGLEVELKVAARKVKVVTLDKKSHIGALPDDISLHLIKLINAGYKYQTIIKSIEINNIEVFIKETKSSKKLKGTPSFNSSHALDDLEISSGSGPNQPPLEIYDSSLEEGD